MLTALHIVKKEHKNIVGKFVSLITPDYITVETKSSGETQLKCVTYHSHREKVNFTKIDKYVKAQRNRLLCDEDTLLDESRGYKRFCSDEYKEYLCTNLALEMLSKFRNDYLKVGLVDINGDFMLYPELLLKYCDSLCVVTEQTDSYSELCDNLLYDTGVAVQLTKTKKSLEQCDFIIAPKTFDFTVSLKDRAVVFTTKKPEKRLLYTVVYDYCVELPQHLRQLKVDFLSDTYLSGALYTLCRMYELGELVPSLCVTQSCVHTAQSLKNMMYIKGSKT